MVDRLPFDHTNSQVIDRLVVTTILFLLPEGEVLLEELDDALRVAEVVLLQLVDLVESLLQSFISQLARLRVILENLVVEHGEVEGKTELDRIASRKVDPICLFIGLLGLPLDVFENFALGVLGNVAVVVAYHLDKKGLSLVGALPLEYAQVDHVDDLLAVGLELTLDSLLVLQEGSVELRVLGVLLDGLNRTAG